MATVFRVGVQAGERLVARVGAAVMVADDTGGAEWFTHGLLDVLQSTDDPSGALAWRVAEHLVAARPEASSFGLVLGLPDGYQLLLYGGVRAVVDGEREFIGQSALTWLDQFVSGASSSIAVTLADEGIVMADPRSDLRDGLLSGDGFVLQATTESGFGIHVAKGQPDPADEIVDTGHVAAPAASQSPDQHVGVPMPMPPAEPPVLASLDVQVGSDASPAGETIALTDSLTALVSDDGERTTLDRPYVLGRDPQRDDRVVNGHASPVRVADPDHLISRVQAYVDVEATRVLVRDADSANGTFVAAPGADQWTRIGTEPIELPVGWSIRMGRRVYSHMGPEAGQ